MSLLKYASEEPGAEEYKDLVEKTVAVAYDMNSNESAANVLHAIIYYHPSKSAHIIEKFVDIRIVVKTIEMNDRSVSLRDMS